MSDLLNAILDNDAQGRIEGISSLVIAHAIVVVGHNLLKHIGAISISADFKFPCTHHFNTDLNAVFFRLRNQHI